MWYGLGAVTVIAICEGIAIVRLSRALAAAARFGERIGHLTSALELLTDTTETGMANVAAELERSAPARTARHARAATARRISSAVKRGLPVERIAANEALSESEIRLHLHLSPQSPPAAERHDAVR